MRWRSSLAFTLLLVSLFFTFVFNIALGSRKIPFGEVVGIIFNFGEADPVHRDILQMIRLPRSLGAIFGGAALSVSGLLLQVFFRNPLAGPFVLGISAGAGLFVGLGMLAGIVFGLNTSSPHFLLISSSLGSISAMALVLIFSPKVKSNITLLLIGVMVSYLCGAITNALIAFAEKERVHGFVLWGMGSFSGICWEEVYFLSWGSAFLISISFLMSKPLNAFLLGEEYAKSMGVNIKMLRMAIVVVSSLLAGIVTAFAGPVAFIGMAVPHIARLCFGTSDNWILIPAVVLLGAAIAGLCDLGARLILSPIELPISAVTSLFGAPLVISLLLRRRMAL